MTHTGSGQIPDGLVVFGTSGHAREIIWIVESAGGHKLLGCLGPRRQAELNRLPVPWLGPDSWLTTAAPGIRYLIGIGSGTVRARLAELPDRLGRRAAVAVHPTAVRGPGVALGEGCVLWPGAVLTRDIELGRHVHVGSKVSVSHDSVLDDYATLLPGSTVAGSTRIGRAATIGAGATVIDGIQVGAAAVVGAGATVIRDVPDETVVVGVPARPLPGRGPT